MHKNPVVHLVESFYLFNIFQTILLKLNELHFKGVYEFCGIPLDNAGLLLIIWTLF